MIKYINLSIVWKFTIAATITTVVAVSLAGWLSFNTSRELLLNASIDLMRNASERQKERLAESIEAVRKDAVFLSNSKEVQGVLRTLEVKNHKFKQNRAVEEVKQNLEQVFSMMIRSKHYKQIRLISLINGMELVRVDAPHGGDEEIHSHQKMELQDKSKSDYIKQGKLLSANQIYISPITLNRENGFIEQPWQPTQRFVVPVFSNIENEFNDESTSEKIDIIGKIRYYDEEIGRASCRERV